MDKRQQLQHRFITKFESKTPDDQASYNHLRKNKRSPHSRKHTPSKSPENRNKRNFIGSLYSKYSHNIDDYYKQNKQNIILYGRDKDSHTPTKSLLEKIKGEQNNIIKGLNMKTLKYGNPIIEGNDKEQLPLTPLPKNINQIDEISKNDKNEFYKAERKAVMMRQVEYTRTPTKRKSNKHSLSPDRLTHTEEKRLIMLVKCIQKWWRYVRRKRVKKGKQSKRQTMMHNKTHKQCINEDVDVSSVNGMRVSSPVLGRNYNINNSNGEQSGMSVKKKKKKTKVNKKYKGKQYVLNKMHYKLNDIDKQEKSIILIQNKIREVLLHKKRGEFLDLLKKTNLYQEHMEVFNKKRKLVITNNEQVEIVGKEREYDVVKMGSTFIINGKYYIELETFNDDNNKHRETKMSVNNNSSGRKKKRYTISNEQFCICSFNKRRSNRNSKKRLNTISNQTNTVDIISLPKSTNINININNIIETQINTIEIKPLLNSISPAPLIKPITPSLIHTKTMFISPSFIINKITYLQHKIKLYQTKSTSLSHIQPISLPTPLLPLSFIYKTHQYTRTPSLYFPSILNSNDSSNHFHSQKNIIKSTSYMKPQPTNLKLLSQFSPTKQHLNRTRCQIRNQIITRNKSSDSAVSRCENLNLSINMHQLSKLHKLKAKRLPNVLSSILNKHINALYRNVFNTLKYYSPQLSVLCALLCIKRKVNIKSEFVLWKTKSQNQNIYFKKRATFTSVTYHRTNTMNTISLRHSLLYAFNNCSSKIEKLINVIKLISYSDFFYRLVIVNLYLNGIDVYNSEIITYIKKGIDKGYMYTLWNVLVLGLKENEIELESKRNFVKYMKTFEKFNMINKGISSNKGIMHTLSSGGRNCLGGSNYNGYERVNSISVDDPNIYKKYHFGEGDYEESIYDGDLSYIRTERGVGSGRNMQRKAIIMKNISLKK